MKQVLSLSEVVWARVTPGESVDSASLPVELAGAPGLEGTPWHEACRPDAGMIRA
ncbi:hypothetical protein [Piscinibacter sp.]|uniref:hypothetical protein n=1 Tax=Piscinibacter sp. TaxID=1903157 RepID=UPI003D101DE1